MSTSTARRGFPWWCCIAVWGLSACQTSPPPPAPPVTEVARPRLPVPADARVHRIVADESLLQIFVYRGGHMARLGHNHVIASRHLDGVVHLTDDPSRTQFDVRFPVNELTVDEPALREAAGADFPAGVPESAREGTRRNLLSVALLDGASHPAIRLRSLDVKQGPGGLDVGVEITIKGQTRQVRVPMQVELRADELVARGEFPLRQSELGLEPFKVAMGTLVVLDEMRVRFEIVAHPEITASP